MDEYKSARSQRKEREIMTVSQRRARLSRIAQTRARVFAASIDRCVPAVSRPANRRSRLVAPARQPASCISPVVACFW